MALGNWGFDVFDVGFYFGFFFRHGQFSEDPEPPHHNHVDGPDGGDDDAGRAEDPDVEHVANGAGDGADAQAKAGQYGV